MTSEHTHKLFLSLLIILSVGTLIGCSAVMPAATTTVMATSTVAPSKTPVPSVTFTLTPEPSLPPTLLPTISLPNEIILDQNIGQLKELGSRELAGIPEEFLHRSIDFTPDGRVVVGDHENTVYVWDGLTGQPIFRLDHAKYLWNVAVSPDGAMAASGGESGIIKVWNLKTGEELHTFTHSGTIWGLAFSPDSTMLVQVLWIRPLSFGTSLMAPN